MMARRMNKPIGVFDSGVGGLTVVKQISKYLPGEDIVYFGDTARVPYGTKSARTVERFSVENALFLLRFGVKCIVVACNTSSAIALPLLRKSFKVPVIGVIAPGAREALSVTRSNRIGVIGTHATISSKAYEKEIRHLSGGVKVVSQSCPLFVSLAEEGWLDNSITRQVARKYLLVFKKNRVDTLILGCTHYPMLKAAISSVLGKRVRLVDSARQCAHQVQKVLHTGSSLSGKRSGGKHRFFVSDEPERFAVLGRKFLGKKINCIRRTDDV